MREIARPEVKRRRRFKRAVVAPAAAVPEPSVADKYYAQKRTCRMVELGIKVPGCKGTFKPTGRSRRITCSSECAAALHRYSSQKSAKKNKHKHRAAINARARANYALKKGTLQGRPCQGPDCSETYYSWHPEKKFCSERCRMNHENAVIRKRRQQSKPARNRSQIKADKRAEQLRPILAELAAMSARSTAVELNRRGIAAPRGGQWYGETVKQLRQRISNLAGAETSPIDRRTI
jgi:hypothetical protein